MYIRMTFQTDVIASKDIVSEDYLLTERPFAVVVADEGTPDGKVCPITLTRCAGFFPID